MERLTKRLENGGYDAGERTLEEIIAELGKYEDFMESIEAELKARDLPCLQYFMENFIPGFLLTLDEMENL